MRLKATVGRAEVNVVEKVAQEYNIAETAGQDQ
jgi:hypothetical protein